MSEKFSARNSRNVSPLRNNNILVNRGSNSNKISTSKRNGVTKKTGEKINEEKKNEGKLNQREVCREEFGTNALNFTLVGSPAPRSQVRALVSSANTIAPKSKTKTTYSIKSREQNPHEICMEKLYQFADNPTKFVRLESARDEGQLHLDLEFSDRSEESENFYHSHNIAFGENGEYRIPEYDHIRFLEFSIGNNPEPVENDDRDNSPSLKFNPSLETRRESSTNTSIKGENLVGILPQANHSSITDLDVPQTPKSHQGDSDLSRMIPRIEEPDPWNTTINQNLSFSTSAAVLENPQSYTLGSAINYKNNINPEVEKFMLDTGPESLSENYNKITQNDRLMDESILSKKFTSSIRLQPFEGSVENSSRTSPVTSRTTLSQASSGDGTWHGHSLNSPYFASIESNSCTDVKKNHINVLPKEFRSYDETEEYLTIVKDEPDCTMASENPGVQSYIFITNQFLGTEFNDRRSFDNPKDPGQIDDSSTRSSVSAEPDKNPHSKIHQLPPAEVKKLPRDISSGKSSPDYCIGNIFSRSSFSSSSSSSSTSRSSSSSAASPADPIKTESLSILSGSLEGKTETRNKQIRITSPHETTRSHLSKEDTSSNGLYMTLEEVNLAADYTSKLSQIFNRVLKRSERENQAKESKEVNTDDSNSQNTSKLIYTCLGSHNFCTSYLSH